MELRHLSFCTSDNAVIQVGQQVLRGVVFERRQQPVKPSQILHTDELGLFPQQDRLDCEDVGDIDVKGFVSPVRAWRLLRTRDAPVLDRAFRGTGKRTRSVCGRNGNMRRNPSRPRHLRARRGWPRQNTAHRGISAQRPSERLRLPQRSGPRFRRRKWTRRGERGDQGKVGAMVRIDQG